MSIVSLVTPESQRSDGKQVQRTELRPVIEDTFLRMEDKYLLPMDHEAWFHSVLNTFMEPSYPVPGTRFTEIESIYLDSDQLSFFQDHFSGLNIRHKIRIRRYASNGDWSRRSPGYIEIKSKENGVSKKARFCLGHSAEYALLRGEKIEVDAELRDANPNCDSEKLEKRVQRLNEIIDQYRIHPMMSVRYRRYAYEKDSIRVTVDSGLQYRSWNSGLKTQKALLQEEEALRHAFEMKTLFNRSNSLLVEVKHQGEEPKWLQEVFQQLSVPKVKFSKYCWSIVSQLPQ